MTRDDVEYGVTDLHTEDTTFLRGMYPTDSEGVMEMKTIFPDFYAGRSLHVHSQVYTDWTLFPNGTSAPETSSAPASSTLMSRSRRR